MKRPARVGADQQAGEPRTRLPGNLTAPVEQSSFAGTLEDDTTGPIDFAAPKRVHCQSIRADAQTSSDVSVLEEDTADLTAVVVDEEESTNTLRGTAAAPALCTVDLRPRELSENHDVPVTAEILPRTGTLLRDRYVLEERIGTGGNAYVFRARDLRREHAGRADQRVAIKVLRDEMRGDGQALARLKQEFSLLQRLAHPHIVRVFDLDVDQGTWFVTMELLGGRTFCKAMRSNTEALAADDVLNVVRRCADALEFAHARGVVHCDLKPGNIFLTHTGDVRLLDFGAACLRTPGAEELAVAHSATLVYASPQVLRHEPCDPRDDIFSLACVTYEALSGQHPFKRKPAVDAQAQGLVVEQHPLLTPGQWRALAAALAFDRDARPASIGDFARQLQEVSPSAPPPASDDHVRNSEPRNFGRLAAGVLLAIGAAAVPFLSPKSIAPVFAPHLTTTPQSVMPQVARASMTLPDATASMGPPVSALLAPLPLSSKTFSEPVFVANAPAPIATAAAAAPRPPSARLPSLSRVALESETIIVSSRASAAVIPLLREGRQSDTVAVHWRTVGGSAQPGIDYQAVDAGIARLHERQSRQMLFVPLHTNSNGAAERSFTVELQRVSSSGQLGKRTATRVIIRDRG